MNREEFIEKLKRAGELMHDEKYEEAIEILNVLREIERKGDFDYNLTHKLYQLISNSHSLLNQQIILDFLRDCPEDQISLNELAKRLNTARKINLDKAIIRKEVELLILRGKLNCTLDGDLLKLK